MLQGFDVYFLTGFVIVTPLKLHIPLPPPPYTAQIEERDKEYIDI